MGAKLVLHEIPGSPNSMKARIALGYKSLEYDRVPIEFSEGFPGERAAVIAASGQPLTPVLIDGDTTIFDSAAILRYLEANFPDTPKLFSENYETHTKIEEWELFCRSELMAPIGMCFGQAMSPEPDAEVLGQACALLNETTGKIEHALGESTFLVGDEITAADVTAAAVVFLGVLPESAGESSMISEFFHANLRLGDGRDRTREWVAKLARYDEHAANLP